MKRARINPVSKKRAVQNREYSQLKKKFLAEHPLCARCDRAEAKVIHHLANREGSWITLFRYVVGLCGMCHSCIHYFPSKNKLFFITINETYADHIKTLTEQGVSLTDPVYYQKL